MPKVARFNRPSHHRVTSVGQFLQQTSAFPAQVRKVSFEDTSCSSDGCNVMQSNPLVGATTAASSSSSSSSCPVYPSIHETSSTVSQDESPSRDTQETADTSSSCSSLSPLHRSRAYESLNEQQFLLQQQKQQEQETGKKLLRRPTTSLCLSDLATAQQSCCVDDDDLTFSPRVSSSSSSSRASPASSPWGHFVDVIPMDNGDCSNSYSLPTLDSDNLEDGYFHPDALLFWSQCSDNKSGHRKGHRFEPYKKSSRLSRKAAATTPTFSSEAFSSDFMLPPPCQAVQQQQPYVARSMRLTREVEETMERLHF